MEPISIIRAVSGAIVPLCSYSMTVYGARKELRDLRHQSTELQAVLKDVMEVLQRTDNDSGIFGEQISKGSADLGKLCEKLEEIDQNIRENKALFGNIFGPLALPLFKSSVHEAIASVER